MNPVLNGTFVALVGWLSMYRYPILVPLTIVEGPVVMIVGGFLVRLGIYTFWPTYLCLMAGDLIGDVLWYSIGYFWGEPFVQRFGHYFSIDEKLVNIVKRFFHEWQTTILIVSKVTMGFGFAVVTLFTAGLVKVPFRKYLLLNVIGEFFWTGLLMAAGFFLANLYDTFSDVFSRVTIFVGAAIFLGLLFGFGKYIRGRIIKRYS